MVLNSVEKVVKSGAMCNVGSKLHHVFETCQPQELRFLGNKLT